MRRYLKSFHCPPAKSFCFDCHLSNSSIYDSLAFGSLVVPTLSYKDYRSLLVSAQDLWPYAYLALSYSVIHPPP